MSLKSKFKKDGESNYNKNSASGFDNYIDLQKFNLERLKLERDKDYLIDILPYQIETENHPNKPKGEDYYTLDIWVHTYIGLNKGSYLCMKKTYDKPCAICEEFERLKVKFEDEGLSKEQVWDKIKHLYPQQRNIYHVLYKDKKYILDVAYKTFEKIWWEAIQKKAKRGIDVTPFYLNEEGCTSLEFSVKSKGKYYDIINFDFPEIIKYDKEVVKNLISLEKLLIIPDQEKLRQILDGNEEIKENKEDEEKNLNEEYYNEVVEKENPIKKKKEVKENTCPFDVMFGIDWDSYESCDKCKEEYKEIWEDCKKANEKI
jgi:hypothetical protein